MKTIKNLFPQYDTFEQLTKKGNIIPIYREILADLETPVSTYLKLADGHPYSFLLESVEGGERWGRYSFIAWDPRSIFASKGENTAIFRPGQSPKWAASKDPLNDLRQFMASFKPVDVAGLPRFWGGAVGYASYDMVRFFEKLPNKPADELDLSDAFFLITDKIVIFDHLSHTAKIVVCIDTSSGKNLKSLYNAAADEIEEIAAKLRKPLKTPVSKPVLNAKKINSNVSKSKFEKAVINAKEYIKSGDIIQVVLSQRFSKQTSAEAFDIYRTLRLINPSPYMYYLKLNDFEIVGSSPEILVRKEDSLAETRPIAGTRPRGKTEAEEISLSRELLTDPKERAEHIMLVDLGRNDLARVCASKSVTVPQLMTIEKYSHVIHIVSSVIGRLNPGTDAFDLFRACFPAGTVSGAPKVRAMEIIDEMETTARGTYAGAVGYFSFSGNMDMAITIRTIVIKNGIAYVQAGAGIVADSVPEKEYQESKNKAAALFAAIERAEQGI